MQRQYYKEHLWTSYRVPYALGGLLARWTLLLRQWRDAPASEAAFQAHAPLQFYDTWVARDADGQLLEKHAPFLRRAAASLPVATPCGEGPGCEPVPVEARGGPGGSDQPRCTSGGNSLGTMANGTRIALDPE